MHRSRVIRHRDLGAFDQTGQVGWSSFTAEINRPRRGSCNFFASNRIAFCTRENNGKSFAQVLARDTGKSFDGPVLGFPNCAGHENNERFTGGHAVRFEEALHVLDCFG